ncbi:MAG: glycosyltransferase [Myxococcales bacterium]|nr:glycosyltransferase [Myxococcales bacterium]
MRVLHVVENFSEDNYGVTTALTELAGALRRSGHDVHILSTAVRAHHPPSSLVTYAPLAKPRGLAWRYAPGFGQLFADALPDANLVHIHGVWMHPVLCAARLSNRHSKPFILSPHNMLSDYSWRHSFAKRIKKSVYWQFARPDLERAAVVHALSTLECAAIKQRFPHNPVVVIPNGIDVERVARYARDPVMPVRPYFAFLGRLDPVKGIELLLESYAQLPRPRRIALRIAGPPSSPAYKARLVVMMHRLGLSDDVTLEPGIDGKEKFRYLAESWAVCLPSISEGISCVALEAMACNAPIITTPGSGLQSDAEGACVIAERGLTAFSGALSDAASWTMAERSRRAKASGNLARHKYAWDQVVSSYICMYDDIIARAVHRGRRDDRACLVPSGGV